MKRRDFLKSVSAAGAALAAPAVWSPARAQSRQETLLVVTEYGPNNLDIHGVGTNRPGYEVSWNCYDRLMSHGTKSLPDGTLSYDRDTFTPELAEDWNATDTSVTFKLRRNAKFHDGTPITAKDVKWSFDRAVSVGGFPTFQMKAGSLEKPEQFVAVDDHTFRVDFIRKDKLTLPDLAVVVPGVYHSELVKKNANEKDPWGLEYTKTNIAGGGAYKVTRWQAGTEVVFERYDDWRSGDLPKVRRVIWRQVPSAGNRRALIERGDADISVDLPNKDFVELKQAGKVSVVTNLIGNGIGYIGMNCTKPPFNNVKVRRAVAYAIPYQQIMDAVHVRARRAALRRQARRANPAGLAAAASLQYGHCQGQGSCWPRAAIRTALRPRCRSIWGLPQSTSRCACWCRRAWPRSASRRRSTRCRAPTGATSS